MKEIFKKRLLIVDDIKLNRMILSDLFADNYQVIEAENGKVALDFIKEYGEDIAIILLDIVMPVLDGFEVLKRMNDDGLIGTVPVILITSENDDEKILEGYTLGVADVINKPFNPDIVARRVTNTIRLYSHKQELEHRLKEQKQMLEQQQESLRQANLFVIDALATTIEYRSFESGEHIKRIRLLTKELLKEMRHEYPLSDEDIEAISNASILHDIGKIAIPDSILLKPGGLTPEEFEVMKTHTTQGCEILSSLNNTQDLINYTYSYEICRYHHERWDGNGYPDGLKGDEIPIWAQVTSLADVYDALTSKRVYKDACSHKIAIKMILNGECGAFNPKLLEAFLHSADKLKEVIKVRNPGLILDPQQIT